MKTIISVLLADKKELESQRDKLLKQIAATTPKSDTYNLLTVKIKRITEEISIIESMLRKKGYKGGVR